VGACAVRGGDFRLAASRRDHTGQCQSGDTCYVAQHRKEGMLTIFTTAKPFEGQFRDIQWNAIKSWTLLRPQPEIIVLGNESGVSEIASTLGLKHIGEVRRSVHGTPLLNSLIETAQEAASNTLMCYINADIILMGDFMAAVQNLRQTMGNESFLLVGRKLSSLQIDGVLEFGRSDWETRLKDRAAREGLYGTTDCDYFVFKKGLWQDIPPFAIGRFYWTQWMMYAARQANVPMIDATPVVKAVEPAHGYSHAPSLVFQREAEQNHKLFGNCRYYSALNASHVLTPSGLKKRPLNYLLRGAIQRPVLWSWHLLNYSGTRWAKAVFGPLRWAYRAVGRPVWPFICRRVLGRM